MPLVLRPFCAFHKCLRLGAIGALDFGAFSLVLRECLGLVAFGFLGLPVHFVSAWVLVPLAPKPSVPFLECFVGA